MQMLDWIKGVMNSPEFLSTITGSVIGGIVTILMFFLQNNKQKKFLEQQKKDDEEKLKIQNQFQKELLERQNDFYQETVEIREKYERERMLIVFLKEKIEILVSDNNEQYNFTINSKKKYEQAVKNLDKNALVEWVNDFEKMQDSLMEIVSNIDVKRLTEKVDGKTYHELLTEIIQYEKNLIDAAKGYVEKNKHINLDEALKSYAQIVKLINQLSSLLIIEKYKIFDRLDLQIISS